ncbi:MAG TPA: KTSC domain-containing protein [Roseiarcus sp.]|jgi:hypothetical protein
MAVQTYSPDSTAISQLIYDDETEQCVVILTDGSRFTYALPQNVMDAWVAAGSAGAFYNTQIRGNFAFFA